MTAAGVPGTESSHHTAQRSQRAEGWIKVVA
jgi:hypothetical protein